MIQWMRYASKTRGAKALFLILAVSFAIWGVGPIFSGSRVQTVAKAGDDKITSQQVEEAYRQQMKLMEQQYGISITEEQAARFGLRREAAQQLVMQSLYSQEAARLGLRFNTETLKQTIAAQPALRGENGKFDPRRFQALLQGMGMNEEGYLGALRGDLTRGLLLGSIQTAVTTPDLLSRLMYGWAHEKRIAEVLEIKAADIQDVPAPTDADLQKYHTDNSPAYMAAETRSFSLTTIDLARVASSINPDEAAVKEVFDSNPQDYGTPEKRTVAQITTSDQAVAEKIAAATAAGRTLQDAAKENGVSYGEVEVARGGTFPQLADVIFGLEPGKTSPAVKSPMGWHVLTLLKTEPAHTPSFDEVRARVLENVRRQQAEEKIYDLSRQLQDTLAGGATLAEAAKQLDLPVSTFENVSADGKGPDGKALPDQPYLTEALKLAFTTGEGETSPVEESAKGLYAVSVSRITPAQIKPLESVKAEVRTAWTAEQRLKRAQARAQELVDKLNSGSNVDGLTRTAPLERAGKDTGKLPAGAVAALFNTKPGTSVLFKSEDGAWILKVAEIVPAPLEGADLSAVSADLKPQLATDLLEQFGSFLRTDYGVSLNEKWLSRQQSASAP